MQNWEGSEEHNIQFGGGRRCDGVDRALVRRLEVRAPRLKQRTVVVGGSGLCGYPNDGQVDFS